jgi:hypothetical protein
MKKYFLFLLSFLVFAPVTIAQFETAEVLGTITDPSGGLLPNVTVVLRNQGTNVESRGRDAGCPAPPAQIRTGSFPACGSYRGCLASKRR